MLLHFSLFLSSGSGLFAAAKITIGKQSQRNPKSFGNIPGSSRAAVPMTAEGIKDESKPKVPRFFCALCAAVCHSSKCFPLTVMR